MDQKHSKVARLSGAEASAGTGEGDWSERDQARAASAARRHFVRLWWVALAGSLVVLYFELDALAKSLHDFDWSMLKSQTAGSWLGLPVEPAASSVEHGSSAHGAPHIVAATFQIATAVAVSWMWFQAFRIQGHARLHAPTAGTQPGLLYRVRAGWQRWWAVGMALVVVVLFIFAMHQAYQPAVFVMAMIAIIVAAEHYSGLMEQQDELSSVTKDLGTVEKNLSTAATDLRRVEEYTGRLVEDAGLSHFVHDVYERYASAREIHAVVRMHDIDPLWWSFAQERDPWTLYFEDAKDPSAAKTSERRNLARALARSDPDTLSACFVSDLPMPGSTEWRSRLTDPSEPLFGDLLGFAWQWIVMHHARQTNTRVNCRAWVSRPLCWVHATDRIVFQVLRREPRSRSAVLVIANMDGLPLSAGAQEAYRSLIQWAKAEVHRYAERGCAAEDYLVAVLRHAAGLASKQGTAELVNNSVATDDLRYLLEMLGAKVWIQSESRARMSPENESAVRAAGDLFAKALVTMFSDDKRTTITVRDLWSKLA